MQHGTEWYSHQRFEMQQILSDEIQRIRGTACAFVPSSLSRVGQSMCCSYSFQIGKEDSTTDFVNEFCFCREMHTSTHITDALKDFVQRKSWFSNNPLWSSSSSNHTERQDVFQSVMDEVVRAGKDYTPDQIVDHGYTEKFRVADKTYRITCHKFYRDILQVYATYGNNSTGGEWYDENMETPVGKWSDATNLLLLLETYASRHYKLSSTPHAPMLTLVDTSSLTGGCIRDIDCKLEYRDGSDSGQLVSVHLLVRLVANKWNIDDVRDRQNYDHQDQRRNYDHEYPTLDTTKSTKDA
jgi:hypothetical protein